MAARKKIRHRWRPVGSGNEQCPVCGLFRVQRHRPGQMLIRRARSITYEVRDGAGNVLSSRTDPGSCLSEPKEQLGLLDLARFE